MENNNYYQNNGYNVNRTPDYVIPEPPKKKSSGGAGKIVALALACSIAGGITGASGMYAFHALEGAGRNVIQSIIPGYESESPEGTILQGKREAKALNVAQVNTDKEMTPAEIYAANVNSTVGIRTSMETNYFGYRTMAAAAGSGFILSDDGYIITNYHVVEDAEEIKVTTYDNKEYDAELIGYDEDNDLAVLKIDAKDLVPVILGDSDNLNVGDSVIAIGNPLGELTFSLTQGAVSALNRSITFGNTSMDLIQTDCAINSGNSGGALFNSHGEVIGITNAKYSGDSTSASIDNIGFAIPINNVSSIITSIIEDGYIVKPYIGVRVYDLEGYPGQTQGAAVYSVEEGSPADKAGLQKDDVITAVNGKDITSQTELRAILGRGQEGDSYKLTVLRDGETLELDVTLAARKQAARRDAEDT